MDRPRRAVVAADRPLENRLQPLLLQPPRDLLPPNSFQRRLATLRLRFQPPLDAAENLRDAGLRDPELDRQLALRADRRAVGCVNSEVAFRRNALPPRLAAIIAGRRGADYVDMAGSSPVRKRDYGSAIQYTPESLLSGPSEAAASPKPHPQLIAYKWVTTIFKKMSRHRGFLYNRTCIYCGVRTYGDRLAGSFCRTL